MLLKHFGNTEKKYLHEKLELCKQNYDSWLLQMWINVFKMFSDGLVSVAQKDCAFNWDTFFMKIGISCIWKDFLVSNLLILLVWQWMLIKTKV
jgi:hypothetical protein